MPIPQLDPRTVARFFPALFDVVFPQLTPGVVAHANSKYRFIDLHTIDNTILSPTALRPAMLAELSFIVGSHRLLNKEVDWDECLIAAGERQLRYYDAVIPERLERPDIAAVEELAGRLVTMCETASELLQSPIASRPVIPGFQWIESGRGDLEAGRALIEVKFSARAFSAADYRQVVIYWLLAQLAAEESGEEVWSEFLLINPKRGVGVRARYSDFVELISAGRSMLEIGQAFRTMVGTRGARI